MDYSSLTDDQQQQQYQQQHQQQYASQEPHHPHPHPHQQQQAYDAYYASAYPQQYYSQDYYQTPYHQPDPTAGPTQIHGYAPDQQQQGGMNPAAAAAVEALSQLSQFAGSMAEIQRQGNDAQPPPPGMEQYHPHPPAFRGRSGGRGGRGGGGSFRGRGGGRGNFNHHPTWQYGGAQRGRGQGRMGRGGGRKSNQSASESQPPYSSSETVVGHSLTPQSTQMALTQTPPALAATAHVLPRRPILPVAWCDICRVDCNSLEILEQHKNGKRHKKTVQRVEEIQKQQRLFEELQAKVMPAINDSEMGKTPHAAGPSSHVSEVNNVSVAQNEAATVPENVQTANLTIKQNSIIEVPMGHTAVGQSEAVKVEAATEASASVPPLVQGFTGGWTVQPTFGINDHFDKPRGGTKRKMTKFGRGGKRLKSSDPVRDRVQERSKEQPRICTLCNATCDTQAVFELHLSGKKHLSKIRRFQGQGTVYGPITVYIPPNQPSAYPTKGQDPLFYGLKNHEMLQLEASGTLNGLQATNYGTQLGDQGEQNREPENRAQETKAMKHLDHPEGGVDTSKGDPNNTESQHNNALDFEVKDPSVSPISLASENVEEDAVPLPEFGVPSGDKVMPPGLDAKVEEPEANAEELTNGDRASLK